jgi:hypothetical protein
MRAALLALLAGGLCAAAHAKVYLCVENGERVFRDRPCADAEEGKPAEKAPTDEFFDLPQPTTATIPIFNQVIAFTLPAHWKPVHQNATKASYIAEFVPREESAQAWKEMITVQGFRDLAQQPRASPINFLARISAGMEKVCGADTVTQALGAVTVDSYEAQAAIIGCASLPRAASGARAGQGEIAYYLAIKGTHELYVIQRAVRGGAFDKRKAPITEANAARILETLQPVKICDSADSREQCAARKPR